MCVLTIKLLQIINQMHRLVFLSIFFLFYLLDARTQNQQGEIKFESKIFIEKRQGMENVPEAIVTHTILFFNENESIYFKNPEIKNQIDLSEGHGRFWRRLGQVNNTTYINVSENLQIVETNFMGKEFLVSDTLNPLKWRISAGEQKQIVGYTCMKAYYKDSLKNLIVYFTPQIPKSYGPENYYGLPGIVLEVQSEKQHIIATEFTLLSPKIVRPKKGEKMNRQKFEEIRDKKMKEQEMIWGERSGQRRN